MTRTIALKRLLLNLQTFRFAAGSLVCLSIVMASSVVSIHDFRQRQGYCQGLELEHQRKLSEARSYNQISARLILKPTPLSLVSEGIGDRYGLAVKIPGGTGPVEVFGRTNANSFLLAFRSLDFAHVVGLLLTLMTLLFTYDAVSGERESGMLRLALANRLPRYKVILGEYLGALLSILVPLLGCFLLWLLLVHVGGGIIFSLDDWSRLALILLSCLLVVSLFALLGLMISSLTHRASTSIILCLFVWVLLSALYPDLSSWAATKLSPMSSRVSSELGPGPAVYEGFLSKAELREMMMLPPEQIKARNEELKRRFQEKGRQLMTGIESERDIEFRQMVNQAKLSGIFQTVSPITAYLQVASILSGTDLGSYIRLRTEARRLNLELARWREEKMQKYPRAAGAVEASLDLSDLPQSSYRQEPLGQSAYRTISPILAIFVLHILFFLATLMVFNRYDAR